MPRRTTAAISIIVAVIWTVACAPLRTTVPVPAPGQDRAANEPEHPPTDAPEAPPVKWGAPPQHGLSAATSRYAVQVVNMGIQMNRLTILYAIVLPPSVLGSSSSFSVTLPANSEILVNQQRFGDLARFASVRSVANVNVGVATFGFGSPRGGVISWRIPGLQVTKPGATPIALPDSVEIQLLQDIAPNQSNGFYQGVGAGERQVGGVKIKGLPGELFYSSKGLMETLGVDLGTAGRMYILVSDRSEITSLQVSDLNDVYSYLGMPTRAVPTRNLTPPPTYPPAKPGVPTLPPLPGPGSAVTITPLPPLLPKGP